MHASRLSEYVHWIVIADPRRYIFSGPSEYERVIFRDSAGAPFGNGFQGPTATVRDLLKSPYAVPRLKGVIVTRMEMGSSLPSSQNRDPVSRTLCAAVREFYVVGVLGRPGERDLAPVCNLIRHPGRCRERNHFGNGVRTGWICGNAGGTKDTARIKGRITFHSSPSDRDATLQPRSRLRVLNSPKSNAAS
jgi:hypothetical protein